MSSWSSDGLRRTAHTETGEVNTVNADGTGVKRLTNNTAAADCLAWGP